MKLCSIIED